VFRTVRQLSLGILRDTSVRRLAMGVVLVAAAAMLFLGATLLSSPLAARPILFLIWWAACAWLTLLAILLALYDLLALNHAARTRRRELLRHIEEELRRTPPARDRDHPER